MGGKDATAVSKSRFSKFICLMRFIRRFSQATKTYLIEGWSPGCCTCLFNTNSKILKSIFKPEEKTSKFNKIIDMTKKIFRTLLLLCVFSGLASAQTTEVKLTLDEQFFDALLEAVFTHLDEPSVAIKEGTNSADCAETIRLKQEAEGVKTAVRFRQGKIYAPLAFEGSYKLPFIGCVDFEGWAETNINLLFDRNKRAIAGKADVLKVNLKGANGMGGELLARFVQNSIDEKINPIKIIDLEKLSFIAPVQNSGKLRMKAIGFSHKVNDANLDLVIRYRFEKAT